MYPMTNYIKETFKVIKLVRENRIVRKENRALKAEVEILRSALRMYEGSDKKNATFPQKSLR